MIKIIQKSFLIIGLIFFSLTNSFSALPGIQNSMSGAIKDTVEGTFTVVNAMILETYNPITHFNKGDYTISFTPGYFQIERTLYIDKKSAVYGKDLDAYGGSFSSTYALTDYLLVNLLYTGVRMDGMFEKRLLNPEQTQFLINGKTSSDLYMGSLGLDFMDIFDSKNWSLPLYFGMFYQLYQVDQVANAVTTTPPYANAKLDGDGHSTGYFLGAAISRKFELFGIKLKATPYFISFLGSSDAKVKSTTLNTTSIATAGEVNVATTNPGAFFPGLKLSWVTDSPIEFSFGISGYAGNWYYDAFTDGLKMRSYTFTITYNSGYANF